MSLTHGSWLSFRLRFVTGHPCYTELTGCFL